MQAQAYHRNAASAETTLAFKRHILEKSERFAAEPMADLYRITGRAPMLPAYALGNWWSRYKAYTQEEYLDYFRKLYTAMELYLRAGDEKSALYCRDKLLTIPDLIAGTAQRTTALAHKTGDDPTITLPQEYTEVLRLLEEGTG